MIVCSCAVITDRDIELALLEIMGKPNAPLPTPGVVCRHLSKRMDCCCCAALAVETIYEKLDLLEAQGLICPCACTTAKDRLRRSETLQNRIAISAAVKEPRAAGALEGV